jgi:hypothetical protein
MGRKKRRWAKSRKRQHDPSVGKRVAYFNGKEVKP